MKIGFYTPYLHILGGGERYVLQMASILSNKHQVDIFGDKTFKKKAENYFGLNLEKVNFIPDIFRPGSTSPVILEKSRLAGRFQNLLSKLSTTKHYDCFFYVTDGSLFSSLAKKNFLIVQVPQKDMYHNDFWTKFKLSFWQTKLVYSNYVKNHIDKWWNIESIVFPPAIDISQFRTSPKENIVLSVGRFFPSPHSKKQEVLVEAFKKMYEQGLKGWKLILAGGVDERGKEYLNMVKEKAKGLPVEIQTNLSYSDLLDLYCSAKIYWHAAGFGEDLNKYPERAEHFGITTLEAMAAGCAPMVFPAGGQREIVEDEKEGLYWKSIKELTEKTINLINNPSLWEELSNGAREKSKEYDLKSFKNKLEELVK